MDRKISSLKCEICDTVFSCKSSRNRHEREQHLQPKLFCCKQCEASFSKKYNLQVHVKNVHSKSLKGIKRLNINDNIALKKLHKLHQKCNEATVYLSKSLENDKETDVKTLAESVLKELKQLQKDIQPPENILVKNSEIQENEIEKSTMNFIDIRDNLYPLGHFALVKAQTIKRTDGVLYLKCEFCSKEFKKTYNYLRHRRIHTKVRPFVCILCNKSFPTTAQLKTHCSIHQLDEELGLFHKFYKCPQCGKGFRAINEFDKHLRPRSPCNVIFECTRCSKCYKTLKTFSSHKHFEKDDDLETLKKLLPRPISLFKEVKDVYERNFCRMYIQRHEKLSKNQCDKSNCTFVSQSTLKIHNNRGSIRKHFKCQYCNKCFQMEQSCRRHMLTHIKQLLITHEVPQDQKYSLTLYPAIIRYGENHIKTVTSIIKSRKHYKNEIETTKEVKYKCSKCEKSFCYKSWMKKHFKYKHSGEINFECSICFKKFRTKQSLEYHILVHSSERTKTTCQVCGKQYASSKSLKIHLRIHTQEKPFQCNGCGKLFRTSGHLIQHRKSIHKNLIKNL